MTVTATAVCSVSTFYSDRFIGKLEHNIRIIFQFRMLRNNIPHFEQKLLIRVSYFYTLIGSISRTDSGRTHHHIHSFGNKVFCHRHKQLFKILPKASFGEPFMSFIPHGLHGGVITPIRIKVHPHEIELPSGSHNSVYHTLIIPEACLHVIVTPGIVIEERAVSLRKTMQIDYLSLFIFKVAPGYIQDWQLGFSRRLGFRVRIRFDRLFRFLLFRLLRNSLVRASR